MTNTENVVYSSGSLTYDKVMNEQRRARRGSGQKLHGGKFKNRKHYSCLNQDISAKVM